MDSVHRVKWRFEQPLPYTHTHTHTHAHDMANLLLDRNFAPLKYSVNIPTIPMMLNPANVVTPLSMPKLRNSGRENIMQPHAMAERKKSLLAKSEAAYCGYDSGT